MIYGRVTSSYVFNIHKTYLYYYLLVLFFLLSTKISLAENVDICVVVSPSYSTNSDTVCNFNAQLGEEINVFSRNRDSVSTVMVKLNPFGDYVLIPPNQSRTIKKRIFWNQNVSSNITYTKYDLRDYLTVEVWADRSNLYVWRPQPNPDTGELVIP